jgi:hypothetical protein
LKTPVGKKQNVQDVVEAEQAVALFTVTQSPLLLSIILDE